MLAGYTPAFAKQSFETYKKVDAPPAATLALALALTTRHSHHQVLEETWDNPKHFDKEASDLVNKLLTKPVKKRIGSGKTGAEDIKKHKWFRGLNWAALYNKQMEPPCKDEVTHPRPRPRPQSRQYRAAERSQARQSQARQSELTTQSYPSPHTRPRPHPRSCTLCLRSTSRLVSPTLSSSTRTQAGSRASSTRMMRRRSSLTIGEGAEPSNTAA